MLLLAMLFFRRRQKNQNNNNPITAAPPTPTPIPTPSVAGFDKPDESEDDEDVLVDEAVGDEDDVDSRGLDVSFARPRISPFSLSHKPVLSAQQLVSF